MKKYISAAIILALASILVSCQSNLTETGWCPVVIEEATGKEFAIGMSKTEIESILGKAQHIISGKVVVEGQTFDERCTYLGNPVALSLLRVYYIDGIAKAYEVGYEGEFAFNGIKCGSAISEYSTLLGINTAVGNATFKAPYYFVGNENGTLKLIAPSMSKDKIAEEKNYESVYAEADFSKYDGDIYKVVFKVEPYGGSIGVVTTYFSKMVDNNNQG